MEIKNLYQNKKVREFLGGIRKKESIQEILNEMLSTDGNLWHWIIRDKRSDEFMGLVSLDTHHNATDIEVSYQFLPKWWGNGYAAETVSEIIKFAFESLDLTRVVAETQTTDIPSRKLLERLGMTLITTYQRFNSGQSLYAIENSKNKRNYNVNGNAEYS